MSLEASDNRESISVAQLAAWRDVKTPHALLDVREDHELELCAIAAAVHIPMAAVPGRLSELPQDVPLVVMCHHGMRSLRVVRFLRHSGWENAVNLEGGIDAWASQVDAGMARY